MALKGKGFYIWQIEKCENGDVEKIADLAKAAGLTHVLIKVADRGQVYYKNKTLLLPLVKALRAQDVSPWGWQYVYGYEPEAEANVAIQQIRNLKLDGFVVNAEHQYKEPGKNIAARGYMSLLKKAVPKTPLGLSSYRYPSYHPQLPWREFLSQCDVNIPQVYWQGSNNPTTQLQRSLREFSSMTPVKPVVPTGSAYSEHNWTPKAHELIAFMDTAKANNLSGVNFWEWSASRRLGFWDVIAEYEWQEPEPQAKDIAQQYVDALNTRRSEEVLKLYSKNSVHVNAARTVQGLERISAWYAQLFVQVLPNATFTLSGYSGTGSSRHLTWTAKSSKGDVLNGNDSLGITDDKIGYHYTFFTVT